jgi:hypothetical protein
MLQYKVRVTPLLCDFADEMQVPSLSVEGFEMTTMLEKHGKFHFPKFNYKLNLDKVQQSMPAEAELFCRCFWCGVQGKMEKHYSGRYSTQASVSSLMSLLQ